MAERRECVDARLRTADTLGHVNAGHANPHANGTYTWNGIDYLQSTVTYTFVDRHRDWVGGAWTPLAWALWAAATILIGRLWQVVTVRRSPAPTG